MRTLYRPLSFESWFFFVGYVCSCLFLMGLPLNTILIILAFDAVISLNIVGRLEYYVFPIIFSGRYHGIFPHFPHPHFLGQTVEEQAQDIQRLYELPWVRANFLLIANTLRVIPLGILWVISLRGVYPTSVAWIYFIFLQIFIVPLYSAFVFIELHTHTSTLIRNISEKHDLKPAFKILKYKTTAKRFIMIENISLLLSIGALAVQVMLVSMAKEEFIAQKSLWIIFVGGAVLVRLMMLYRGYLFRAMREVIYKERLVSEFVDQRIKDFQDDHEGPSEKDGDSSDESG